jgi:hypothetical protein
MRRNAHRNRRGRRVNGSWRAPCTRHADQPTTPATGIKPDRTIADPATRKATREKGRIAKEARRLPQSGAATKSGADQAARLHQGLHVAFMSRD